MPGLEFIKTRPCEICENVEDGRSDTVGPGSGREAWESRVHAVFLQISAVLPLPGRLSPSSAAAESHWAACALRVQ